ncbi:HAD family hydrolase [Dyadobacter sp. MSC1_007]|jgi:phosphatidylglycerophosphatase C|uniref:HAD family hydrolase n=1 Tax=Dyadobacter sp. MSC1_007 TaxID=2909264 RepID=UPI00202E2139|nr:HAD family hydrolase [Dyadobacter sp. MSC1_007]
MKKGLALFDFDGTISSKDSFLYFLRYTHNFPGIVFNVVRVAPYLVAFKLGMMSNEAAKMKLFNAFYKGVSKDQFDSWARGFLSEINSFIKPKALEQLRRHKEKGDRVVIVSAGFDLILKYWCEQEGVELLATCVDVQDNVITGRFKGPNCYGIEKVNRINAHLKLADYEQIYAYGDSSGDLEMMKISNNPTHHKRIFST